MPRKKQKLCFVLMPFKEELKEIYSGAIRPACVEAGFKSLRVDELEGVFNINRKIIEHIFASDAIIADLTDWNPNVFYEMGVAHAIDNKTIMIIGKKDKVPFDVSTYSCILYDKSEKGLVKLKEHIVKSLKSIEQWRKQPTNPVQDYKPGDSFIPRSVLAELQKELQKKEMLLKTSAPKADHEALRKELRRKEALLAKSLPAAEAHALKKALQYKETENSALKQELQGLKNRFENEKSLPKAPKKSAPVTLRSEPVDKLSDEVVRTMLKERDFFDSRWNKNGRAVHQFEKVERRGEKLVVDHSTGLNWQQAGSDETVFFKGAQDYIQKLNAGKYGGYDNWRLPTLEEAMSLMEPEVKNGDLYIEPVFDKRHRWIWTVDKPAASRAWVVFFSDGFCIDVRVSDSVFVRAVR